MKKEDLEKELEIKNQAMASLEQRITHLETVNDDLHTRVVRAEAQNKDLTQAIKSDEQKYKYEYDKFKKETEALEAELSRANHQVAERNQALITQAIRLPKEPLEGYGGLPCSDSY